MNLVIKLHILLPKSHTWNTKPMLTTGILENIKDMKDILPSSMNTRIVPEVPWYREWSGWLWYGGAILGVISIAGLAFVGYSYYQSIYSLPGPATPPMDPTIFSAGTSAGSGTPTNPPVVPQADPQAGV